MQQDAHENGPSQLRTPPPRAKSPAQDLAKLFVKAQRRNADRSRGTVPRTPKEPKEQPGKLPGASASHTPASTPPKSRSATPKPSTPIQRTIHASLPKDQSPRAFQRTAPRVYAPDKRKHRSEFSRSLSPAATVSASADKGDKGEKPPESPRPRDHPKKGPKTSKDEDSHSSDEFKRPAKDARKPSERDGGPRLLFDPRQHDPVKFAKGSPKPAEANAAPESPRGNRRKPIESTTGDRDSQAAPPPALSLVDQIKKAYQGLVDQESKCLEGANQEAGARDDKYWLEQIRQHKDLANAHYHFLRMSTDPRLPSSHQSMPQKHHTPARLWKSVASLVQRLQTAQCQHPAEDESSHLMDCLVSFLEYAYVFYIALLDDPTLQSFRSTWLEHLGDLSRCRVAVAGLLSKPVDVLEPGHELVENRVEHLPTDASGPKIKEDSAEIASIGDAALGDWEVVESDVWRRNASEWYNKALAELPGSAKVHWQLAEVCEHDELRQFYHYCRCYTASQANIKTQLPGLSLETGPTSSTLRLFLALHGMIIERSTSIDKFGSVLAQFIEKLEIEHQLFIKGNPQAEVLTTTRWLLMAVINTAALLEYGSPSSVLSSALAREPLPEENAKPTNTPSAIMLNPSVGKARRMSNDSSTSRVTEDTAASAEDDEVLAEDVRRLKLNSPAASKEPLPLAFRLAQRLSFAMLEYAAQRVAAAHPSNSNAAVMPYVSILTTFLAFVSSRKEALRLVERSVPWQSLIQIGNQIPRSIELRVDPPSKLLGQPLPEDWCIRGMEWTGRHFFGRGYWKYRPASKAGSQWPAPSASTTVDSELGLFDAELDELRQIEAKRNGSKEADAACKAELEIDSLRWKRIANGLATLCKMVPGLAMEPSSRNGPRFKVLPSMGNKLKAWAREGTDARVKDGQSPKGDAVSPPVDSDEDDRSDGEGLGTDEASKQVKLRRHELRAIVKQAKEKASTRRYAAVVAPSAKSAPTWQAARKVHLQPGYTVLFVDSTVLLNTLPLFASLLECRRWSIVVPLAVVLDLDSYNSGIGQLGSAAAQAIRYLELHQGGFQVQTSAGNYLSDLSIRKRPFDLSGAVAPSTEEALLQAAMTHQNCKGPAGTSASRAAILSLNRALRQRARSKGVEAINELEAIKCVLPRLPDG